MILRQKAFLEEMNHRIGKAVTALYDFVPTAETKGKKPATILEPDDILSFGKYKGRTVIDVFCENYQCLQWAEGNVKDFLVNWQALMRVHREKRNQSATDNQTYSKE